MYDGNFHFAAHSVVLLKAETLQEKVEWLNKLRSVIQSRGGDVIVRGEPGLPMRQSHSDGSLVSCGIARCHNFVVSFGSL